MAYKTVFLLTIINCLDRYEMTWLTIFLQRIIIYIRNPFLCDISHFYKKIIINRSTFIIITIARLPDRISVFWFFRPDSILYSPSALVSAIWL